MIVMQITKQRTVAIPNRPKRGSFAALPTIERYYKKSLKECGGGAFETLAIAVHPAWRQSAFGRPSVRFGGFQVHRQRMVGRQNVRAIYSYDLFMIPQQNLWAAGGSGSLPTL